MFLLKLIIHYIYVEVIIMFVMGQVRSLFLNPQSGVGPSITPSVVRCSVFLLVCISVSVLAVYLYQSSVRVVATFCGAVLYPLLCSVFPSFSPIHWFFPLSNSVIPSKCLKNFICAASKRCSSLSSIPVVIFIGHTEHKNWNPRYVL